MEKNIFGMRLKALRVQKNLSQKELSDDLEIGRPTITQYETGSKNPSLKMVIKIADYFDVSVDYLIGRKQK
ncbi:MAG: helix-turn-helix transcriptional regulator [Clostridiaceae bacterium]|nr:helix-turn-helix transcriptional regulator [Clostridiaceae bacterium]